MTTVLHVPTVSWSPREGVSRVVTELAAAAPWHEHHLVAARPHALAASTFASVTDAPGWMGRITFSPEFAARVHDLQPDVVHLHGGALVPALAAAPALRDVPVVASVYGPFVPLRHRHGARSAMHASGAKVAPLQSLVTSAAGATVGRWALRSGRVRAVCTPDELVADALGPAGPVLMARGAARVGAIRARWSAEPIIGFAGRAERGRGIEDLVDAFEVVRREVPAARLRLFLLPNGDRTSWLRSVERRPGVEVRVGESELLEQDLAGCQVVVLPFRRSMTITPPLVAAETMAVGVPIVATSVPCMDALVEDRMSGRTVAPGDVDGLAAAIVWVVADPARWQALADHARSKIEQEWSWETAAAAVDAAYALASRKLLAHAV